MTQHEAMKRPGSSIPDLPNAPLVPGPSPLAQEGWLEFNRLKWGVRPIRIHHDDAGAAKIDAVFYLNRAGQITLPPLNFYAPLSWSARGTDKSYQRHRQWLALAQPIVDEMRARGLDNRIRFPVGVDDMRPWQWAGFRVTAAYTFLVTLPLDPATTDPPVRGKIRQASKRGYTWDRAFDPKDVLDCLIETERRQHFSYNLTLADFNRLSDLVGPEHLRIYVCYAPNGEPASVRIILHAPGHTAIDWVAGTASRHLQSGATQLLIRAAIDDVAGAGATALDFGGANIPGVAAAKMTWGARLLPWYQVESFGLRGLARWTRDWLRYRRAAPR
jgi:hypothetical protein